MTKRRLMDVEVVVVDGDGSADTGGNTMTKRRLMDVETVVPDGDACPIGEDCGPGTGPALLPQSNRPRKELGLNRRIERAEPATK